MGYRDRPESWRPKGWFQPQPSSGYDTGKLSTAGYATELGSPVFLTAPCGFLTTWQYSFPLTR